MSDIKDFYITLQKFFWAYESDLSNQMNLARHDLIYHRPDADNLVKPIVLSAKINMLNEMQRDINKILEVYLHEE